MTRECETPRLRSTFACTRGPKVRWSVKFTSRAPHCAAARPAMPVPVPKSNTRFPATRWRCRPRNRARSSPCVLCVRGAVIVEASARRKFTLLVPHLSREALCAMSRGLLVEDERVYKCDAWRSLLLEVGFLCGGDDYDTRTVL